MKEIIDRIIDIDKKTKTLVSNTDEQIIREREELRKELADLEKNTLDQAKKKAQDSFDELVSKTGLEVEKRKQANLEELKLIEENYQSKKDRLIEKVLENIILNVDDD